MIKVIWAVVAAAAVGAASISAAAQSQRPVRMLVASAPGGPSDVQARLITPKMSEVLARTLVVDNRASANGLVATEMCSRAEPDGATVCVGNSGTHAVNATLYLKLSYDPIRDFVPISQFSTTGMVLAAPSAAARRAHRRGAGTARLRLPVLERALRAGEDRPARRAGAPQVGAGSAQHPGGEATLSALGLVTVGNTPDEFAQVVKTDVEKFRKIILESGITRL